MMALFREEPALFCDETAERGLSRRVQSASVGLDVCRSGAE
jgi:hypothetical protein